ncbi:uncharacterized protein LOC124926923 [Impatiens glandulifera]|uniref:uncharacterized protein LOC124926923 n=1 Tax=Impatiens glandulifera TaxID=253017 RepID=UPI001FB10919|nr:uncharacterized protein LOC124926923 [Impatiens glandulifera]
MCSVRLGPFFLGISSSPDLHFSRFKFAGRSSFSCNRVDLMTPLSITRNRYWILRHGKSIPNEKGLIVSSLENGRLEEYRLATEGIDQANLAGESFRQKLLEENIELKDVRICYSPFSRTSHTAKVVASTLDIPFEGTQCKAFEDLRERYFGPSFELQSHDKYAEIWGLDENDPFMKAEEGGESVFDVSSRLIPALIAIDAEFERCAILVVSHGDPLQILQTLFNAAAKDDEGSNGKDLVSRLEAVRVHEILSQHRNYALSTGELRALI